MASFVSAFVLGAATGSATTYAAMSADTATTILSNAATAVTKVSSTLGKSLVSIGNWLNPEKPPQEHHLD